jgi:hypothetical protein
MPRQELQAGQELISAGGQYQLVMQTDGNLVTYGNAAGRPAPSKDALLALWGSRTGPLWLTWAFYAARSYSLRSRQAPAGA